MEIMIPVGDFDFNSARSTPYATALSTPRRFGECYFSAPPSPGHLLEFYRDYDDFYVDDTKSCFDDVPVGWEEKTKTASPRFRREKTIFDDDFAFDVSGESEKMTLPAEELFDGGKIRPLKPPTMADLRKREDQSHHDLKSSNNLASNTNKRPEQERGRERNISSLPSSSSRRGSRSVSPYRVSKYPWEEEEEEIQSKRNVKQSLLSSKPELASTSSKSGSKKWRLKDFFLFRSASEGRASDKDPLRKYTALFKKNDEKKISSKRMGEGESTAKRKGPVELHYTKNRAVSEDLKKKTFLPYKHGILGRWFV